MTLLRLIHALPLPTPETPRVLGVDDWALRRGRTYGTILVAHERHQVLDLLPDRTDETLAAWLRAHPGVEIVTRDRAGAYAEGIRQGAPDAEQVADAFHVVINLRDALERFLSRHHGCSGGCGGCGSGHSAS
jgi:transposase